MSAASRKRISSTIVTDALAVTDEDHFQVLPLDGVPFDVEPHEAERRSASRLRPEDDHRHQALGHAQAAVRVAVGGVLALMTLQGQARPGEDDVVERPLGPVRGVDLVGDAEVPDLEGDAPLGVRAFEGLLEPADPVLHVLGVGDGRVRDVNVASGTWQKPWSEVTKTTAFSGISLSTLRTSCWRMARTVVL